MYDPTKPALTLNADKFAEWAATEADTIPHIHATYTSRDGEAGFAAQSIMNAIIEAPADVLVFGPGIDALQAWPTADGDGIDGGALITIADDGVELAVRYMSARDLIDGEANSDGVIVLDGADAAARVVHNITEAVNDAVRRHREKLARIVADAEHQGQTRALYRTSSEIGLHAAALYQQQAAEIIRRAYPRAALLKFDIHYGERGAVGISLQRVEDGAGEVVSDWDFQEHDHMSAVAVCLAAAQQEGRNWFKRGSCGSYLLAV